MYFLRESGEPFRLEQLPINRTFFFPEATIAADFAKSGIYERRVMDWIRDALLPEGTVFVDIGAHVGTYTLTMAPKASTCVAFECTPRTYNYLCANVALHHLDHKVEAHRVALGNTNGTTRLFLRSEDGGGNGCLPFTDESAPSVVVPLRTLDSYGLQNVGLIKLDVEGLEKEVLEGARETLRANGYPKIIFESWADDTPGVAARELRETLFAYVRSLGYDILGVSGSYDLFLAEYVEK
jgi:FkbM family methyltransferase